MMTWRRPSAGGGQLRNPQTKSGRGGEEEEIITRGNWRGKHNRIDNLDNLGREPQLPALEEEEEEFITIGNWRGKHNSLSRGDGAGPPRPWRRRASPPKF